MGMEQSLAYRQLVFLTLKEIYHTYCLHDILRHNCIKRLEHCCYFICEDWINICCYFYLPNKHNDNCLYSRFLKEAM